MSPATSSAPLTPSQTASKKSSWKFYALFFTSGFPALIYQIVWQRTLFTLYGINIQAVTVIVTVFMIGLGLGSLAGGKLSTARGVNVLRAFGLIECSIGVFGAVSLPLFHFVAQFTAGASTTFTGFLSFFLLLIPTLLMGSTLPLLVVHLVRRTENVGESLGSLYSVNTLGSAVACFAASMFVMRLLGQSGAVHVASAANFFVGAIAILLSFRSQRETKTPPQPPVSNDSSVRSTIPMATGMILAAISGFIALAFEILWFHIYSFTSGSKASCFARLLGWYLVGIAYGSLVVHDACKTKLKNDLARTIRGASMVLAIGTLSAYLVTPLAAIVISNTAVPYDLTFVFVSISAALLGAAFPIISHASIDPNDQAGKKVSYLYLSNIIGSALGSFIIGFIAMDHLSTAQISLSLLVLGELMALILATMARPIAIKSLLTASLLASVVAGACSQALFSRLFERLMMQKLYKPGMVFKELVENRSGIIAVDPHDDVYGGGVYDGGFNIEPVNARNGIFRAYAIAGIHPAPKRVLIIGLSSGSWAQVLVHHPRVEDSTVVEINPGYLPLMEERPIVSSLLHNPKVHIVIDDGRRWLLSHPESKFDFILMNSTWNWRANATNLLSVEFLQLARRHLNLGGVLYYNTTGSGRVQFTGATVFPYALRISNFLAVSDSPIRFDRPTLKSLLATYRIDDRPMFNLSKPEDQACLEQMVSLAEANHEPDHGSLDWTIEDRASLLTRLKGSRLITDDNMGTEWQ